MSNTLVITSWKQRGKDLHDAIVREVKPLATSKLITPVPDKLLMTQAQYDDLNQLSGMYEVYHTDDKMYQTPYNVMEVEVLGRKRLTFRETMDLDDKAFNEWERSVGL